jgi:hypothetical protein
LSGNTAHEINAAIFNGLALPGLTRRLFERSLVAGNHANTLISNISSLLSTRKFLRRIQISAEDYFRGGFVEPEAGKRLENRPGLMGRSDQPTCQQQQGRSMCRYCRRLPTPEHAMPSLPQTSIP